MVGCTRALRGGGCSLSASMARRISLGRRSICHAQLSADHARRAAPDLVFTRCAFTIFSARLHRFAARARALGFESNELPLAQFHAAAGEGSYALAHAWPAQDCRALG